MPFTPTEGICMDQRPEDKTVSAEESLRRLNTLQFVFFSVLLALPLIGMMVGFVVAIRVVIFVVARSKNMALELAISAGTIAVGFLGMIVEIVWMSWGHVVLAIAADVALNYCILTMILNKRMGHIFTKPELQASR
jgi:hypothetical protein